MSADAFRNLLRQPVDRRKAQISESGGRLFDKPKLRTESVGYPSAALFRRRYRFHPTDVRLVDAGPLGQLRLGERLLLAELSDLDSKPIGALEDRTLALGCLGQPGSARGSGHE